MGASPAHPVRVSVPPYSARVEGEVVRLGVNPHEYVDPKDDESGHEDPVAAGVSCRRNEDEADLRPEEQDDGQDDQ